MEIQKGRVSERKGRKRRAGGVMREKGVGEEASFAHVCASLYECFDQCPLAQDGGLRTPRAPLEAAPHSLGNTWLESNISLVGMGEGCVGGTGDL